jgi:hypothetical protein
LSGWLSAADIAAEFERTESWRRAEDAEQLIEQVSDYMARRGLEKSSTSRIQVAHEIVRLRTAKPEPARRVDTPEESAWEADQLQGYGPRDPALAQMDEAMLAQRVKTTSMADWHAERIRLGIAPKSSLDVLSGAFGSAG